MKTCQCEKKQFPATPDDPMNPFHSETELRFRMLGHEPHECTCALELALYARKGKRLFLCSLCHVTGDIRCEEEETYQ